MYPYRVFISYSHEDEAKARRIAAHLRRIGLNPICMLDFAVDDYVEQIRNGIAYAHAFMPVLTKGSESRPWVQQEIGYAMGLEVPVLPVAIGHLPEAFIQRVNALRVDPELRGLARDLTPEKVERVVHGAQRATHAVYDCARDREERSRLIGTYARRVLELGAHGKVRQRGGLTSLSNPDSPADDPVWASRYGGEAPDESYCELLREERIALQEHAEAEGCDLVVDTSHDYKDYGPAAWRARLETFLEFLESMPDRGVRVVLRPRQRPENLLLVGDWYMAESVSVRPKAGYSHTIVTRHAPTVLRRVNRFDSDFAKYLKEGEPKGGSSRRAAIRAVKEQIGLIEA